MRHELQDSREYALTLKGRMYLAAELGRWAEYKAHCKALAIELQYGQALAVTVAKHGCK